MAKILVTGAGSAQSNAVINCLRMDSEDNIIIGTGSDEYDILLCNADKKYVVPHSSRDTYQEALLSILDDERPDMIHFQHDKELLKATDFIDEINKRGVKLFIPDVETIDQCVHKYKSWKKFKENGIVVPNNMIINDKNDLEKAFLSFGSKIWLRSMDVGGGGLGSLAAESYEEAVEWIDKNHGWGSYLAAELLTDKTITWQSVWNHGELVVAQGRRRFNWAFGALSASGVTGITRVCETVSDDEVDRIGIRSCKAVSSCPHGVYGVDMTYDTNGIPNPTEINIGRFFTTVQFFAEAGLNLPVIIKDLCLHDKYPNVRNVLNPLENGLLWVRGMDVAPRLITREVMNKELIYRI